MQIHWLARALRKEEMQGAEWAEEGLRKDMVSAGPRCSPVTQGALEHEIHLANYCHWEAREVAFAEGENHLLTAVGKSVWGQVKRIWEGMPVPQLRHWRIDWWGPQVAIHTTILRQRIIKRLKMGLKKTHHLLEGQTHWTRRLSIRR